jgi:hypothetical protein
MNQWEKVVGFPHYEVSTKGSVRSLPRMVERCDGQLQGIPGGILSPVIRDNHGTQYGEVTLSDIGSGRRHVIRKVHHLILETFIGPRPEGMVTRHLNGDSLDNRLENLIYGTHEQNVADRSRQGRTHRPAGELNGRAKLTGGDVELIRRRAGEGVGRMALACQYNVSVSLIYQIVRGAIWTEAA